MDYKIVEKEAFSVIGVSKKIDMHNKNAIKEFWEEHIKSQNSDIISGTYGVCIHEGSDFEYMIADDYSDEIEESGIFEIRLFPKLSWAVFPCIGVVPESIISLCDKIFDVWLPNSEYERAAMFDIEVYTAPSEYEKGMRDCNYYAEIWLPVRKKEKSDCILNPSTFNIRGNLCDQAGINLIKKNITTEI